jgi:Family of unknown function (DUF5808)
MARKPQGHFLGIPYNWRRPTLAQLGRDLWDPKEPRIFPPRSFGWGWGLNFAALLRRLLRR